MQPRHIQHEVRLEIFQEDVVYDYIGPEILYPFPEVLQGLSHFVFGHLVFGLDDIVDLIAHQCGCCVNGPQNSKNIRHSGGGERWS